MHAVIRADGGSNIGYGHLIRSATLAEAVISKGHTVTVGTATPEPARTVLPAAVDVVDLPTRGDPDPFVEWLDTATPDVVFTDAYPVDTAYQRRIRGRVPIAVLQDDGRHAVCADLFANGNLYATELSYDFVGEPPTTCLGPEYVLLRREIRDRTVFDPPWRAVPERAIIMMGGSDVAGLTPTVVRAFDGFDLRVDAIVGPGCSATQEQAVRTEAAATQADVRVTRDPDDLVDRMFQADFAVSTASSTTYELLALGTPLLSIPVVANQSLIADALQSRDAATVLRRDADKQAFRTAIEAYVTDAGLRQRRRQTGHQLVDGKGTERLVAKILSIAVGNQQP